MPTFRTSQPGSAADPSKPHLFLVGLPGSGKTSVGQEVAARTGRTFLDLDQEIERREGRTISEIFGQNGERYFRRKERELTEELRLVGNMIISPGGGWVTQPKNIEVVRPPGRLVYLRVRPDTALERLGPMRMLRPLLMRPDPQAELERLLEAREDAYESADFVVNADLYDLQRVIEKVIELASAAG
ncbi:MAG TPA: shikimate kinase [Gemmatimonadaceae bacterium]|jgi:shikimate kinase|nr:shikimate kinase [Gemmatimonadaceae bacterium]